VKSLAFNRKSGLDNTILCKNFLCEATATATVVGKKSAINFACKLQL